MNDIVLAIVKAKTVPSRMLVAVTGIEILIGVTGQIAQSLDLVLYGMGVNNVHDDGNAHPMGSVNKGLELLGRAETTGGSKERADVIAETAVVRVFGDGHQLDGVIAGLFDARQDVRGKFVEAGDPFLLAAHADVGFVNQRHVWRRWNIVLPLIWLIGLPDYGRKIHRIIILYHVGGI